MFLLLILSGCPGNSGQTIIECGGGMQFRCPKGSFCDFGADCGGIDAKGQCRRQPPECEDVQRPVCGCNGITYANACYCHGSGISVAYEGECIK